MYAYHYEKGMQLDYVIVFKFNFNLSLFYFFRLFTTYNEAANMVKASRVLYYTA